MHMDDQFGGYCCKINCISAQATRAGLRAHTLGQFAQHSESETATSRESVVEAAATSGGYH